MTLYADQIKCLKIFKNVFPLAGLMPLFNFETCLIEHRTRYKIYSLFLCIASNILWFYGFYHRMKYSYIFLLPIQSILMTLLEFFSITIVNEASLGSGFFKMNKWEQYIQKCLYVEEFLHIRKKTK